jgi:hypothetical protein
MDIEFFNWKYSAKRKYLLYGFLVAVIGLFVMLFPADENVFVFYWMLGGLGIALVLGILTLVADYQRHARPKKDLADAMKDLKSVFDELGDGKGEAHLICLPYPVAACEVVHGGVRGVFQKEPVEVHHLYQATTSDDLKSVFFDYGMFTAFSTNVEKEVPDFMMILDVPMQWTEKRWVEHHAEPIADKFSLLVGDDQHFEDLYRVYGLNMLKKYEHLNNFGAIVCQDGKIYFLRKGYTWDPDILKDYLETLVELRKMV